MLLKVVCVPVTSREQKYAFSLYIYGAWLVIILSGISYEGCVFYVNNTKKYILSFLLGKPEWRRLLGKCKERRQDNIKTHFI